MSDQRMLLLVLIVIYLSECFVWVGHGAVAIRSSWRRFRAIDPPIFPGNDRGGWTLLNPLPPFGEVFVCHQWPVVVTPTQVGPQTGQSINFRERPPTESQELGWAAAAKLESAGPLLSLGGEPMMRLPDDAAADHFAGVITRVAKAAPEQRQTQIARAIADAFDTAAISKRLDEYARRTRFLRPLCMTVFTLLFVLLPLSIYLERFVDTVYRILPVLFVSWLLVLGLYFRAHRKLLPAQRLARWKGLVTMVFAPTASIRACDAVSRRLLTGYDPVAVAAVLFDKPTFADFATRVLRDLQLPLPPKTYTLRSDPADQTRIDTLATEFREQLASQVVRLLESRDLNAGVALATPQPADPSHQAYCPRCRLEYLIEAGTCRDCGETALVQFNGAMKVHAVASHGEKLAPPIARK